MQLTDFLTGLFNGQAITASELHPFSKEDKNGAISVLQNAYDLDKLEMPGTVPEFDKDAALWAALYLYHLVQLLLIRDIGADKIDMLLPEYSYVRTPEAIYSADLVLRHLPVLFGFAKMLAPEDPLNIRLKKTATEWPFSSVGSVLDDVDIKTDDIVIHPSLRVAYADRIIAARDLKRAERDNERSIVNDVLGNYSKILWPEFEALQ